MNPREDRSVLVSTVRGCWLEHRCMIVR